MNPGHLEHRWPPDAPGGGELRAGGRSLASPSLATLDPGRHRLDLGLSGAVVGELPTWCALGGISRLMTFSRIDLAQGRALQVSSDIGADSPGRWHSAQCLKNIGATSLLKVTSLARGGLTALLEEIRASHR